MNLFIQRKSIQLSYENYSIHLFQLPGNQRKGIVPTYKNMLCKENTSWSYYSLSLFFY